MGCCQSANNAVEREQTRPLMDDTSLEHEATVFVRQTNEDEVHTSQEEFPKWDASAQLRAIEERLEASLVDISILDGHAFVSRNHSPGRRFGGDESPPPPRQAEICSLRINPAGLTGPPSVADALSKPLPTRQSVEWGRTTAEDLLGALRADLQDNVTHKRELYQVLPFPPLLMDPSVI